MTRSAQLVAGAFAAAAVGAAALIAASLLGAARHTQSAPPPSSAPSILGVRETRLLLRGIRRTGSHSVRPTRR
jgi:hypothetical protein